MATIRELQDLGATEKTAQKILEEYDLVPKATEPAHDTSIEEATDPYNNRRHGKPWITKVTGWDSAHPDLQFGDWIGRPGDAGILEIKAKPSDVVRIGQKDYRRGDKSRDDWYIVSDEGTLEEVSKVEARQHWKRRTA